MSDQKQKAFSLSKLRNKKYLPVLSGIGFLVIILAVFGILIFNKDESGISNGDSGPVLFKIEGKEYRQGLLDDITKYPVEVGGNSKAYALQYSFESLKKIAAAEKLGAKPPDSVVDRYLSDTIPADINDDSKKKEDYLPWFKMLATVEAIEDALDTQPAGEFTGYSHVFYFGQHIEYGEDYKPEGLNNPALIEQDKKYAKEKAEYYHSQLKGKKISNDQIEKEVRSDPKLKTFVPTKNPFGKNSSMSWEEDVFYQSIRDYLKITNKSGLSDVQTGSNIPGPTMGPTDKPVELYYFFVDVEKAEAPAAVSTENFYKSIDGLSSEYLADYDENSYPIKASNIKEKATKIEGSEVTQ